jgi:tripartite-type tricarboxylate transporter receptor subunit TctC
VKDFSAIGMIGATPNVLVVNAALPVKTVKEFIEYVRKNPGRISYGSAGQGSLTHLTMELFKQQIESFMVHIPYRGIAPAFTDLIGGQTQAMFPGLAAAVPHIRSGRVRPLAVTGLQRHPQFKDLPTLDESGFKGFDAQQWYGVVGPAGMPAPIVRQLNETLAMVLRSPELREKLSVEAIEPQVMSPEQFAAFIKADIERWTQLARDRKIQLDS